MPWRIASTIVAWPPRSGRADLCSFFTVVDIFYDSRTLGRNAGGTMLLSKTFNAACSASGNGVELLLCDARLLQIFFETIDGIVVLRPPFDFTFCDVTLIIVFSVTFAAISFRFDQHGAVAAARVISGELRRLITRDDVVAVDDITRDAVTRGFLREIFNCRLQTRRR